MKRFDLQKSIIGILILLFVLISFTPCIKVATDYIVDNGIYEPYVEHSNYLPQFCCVISLLELLLLFFFNRTWSKIAGLVLNLIKTVAPLPLFKLLEAVFASAGGLTSKSYSYDWLGYLLLCLGLLIEIIEFTSLFSRRKNV